MATINPEHLIEQAERLIRPPSRGRPREADLRRAASSAYYAVFHAIVTAAADAAVGVSRRRTALHTLVTRSIDHRTIRTVCIEVLKSSPSPSYRPFIPISGFHKQLPKLAAVFPTLQELRHTADYGTSKPFTLTEARNAIAIASSALHRFRKANPEDKRLFLFLILFPPRSRP